jgi:hypothetical protein
MTARKNCRSYLRPSRRFDGSATFADTLPFRRSEIIRLQNGIKKGKICYISQGAGERIMPIQIVGGTSRAWCLARYTFSVSIGEGSAELQIPRLRSG